MITASDPKEESSVVRHRSSWPTRSCLTGHPHGVKFEVPRDAKMGCSASGYGDPGVALVSGVYFATVAAFMGTMLTRGMWVGGATVAAVER